MKAFIIAAVSADGFIAKDSAHFPDWTGPEDVKLFVRLTKEAGVIVMGANTLRTLQKMGRRLPGRRLIVYTRNPATVSGERVEATNEAPAALLTRLAKEGVERVAICGGTSIYQQFMEAGVVDELYISVAPVLFGAGLALFNAPLQTGLQLLEATALGDGTVALHYQVTS